MRAGVRSSASSTCGHARREDFGLARPAGWHIGKRLRRTMSQADLPAESDWRGRLYSGCGGRAYPSIGGSLGIITMVPPPPSVLTGDSVAPNPVGG